MSNPYRAPAMPKTSRKNPETAPRAAQDDTQPPAEEDYGGGDIASPEVCPPTDDDKPLD